jgi:Mg-chelatase subunit ChlD
MSFLAAAALAVGILVTAPWFAHLLRRGRATRREFPPSSLVPSVVRVARSPGRLEDHWLFALRALLIMSLAVLGATPLFRCSRLRFARPHGASVALAIVLDDSLSMRAGQRWERAVASARALVRSGREGDAVSLVLAGRPARLLLSATTDLAVVRNALERVMPSDRSTDLEGAVAVARSALQGLPQAEHQIMLFSDLAGRPPAAGQPPIVAPLSDLRDRLQDCGIVSAQGQGRAVSVVVVCTNTEVARGRKVELLGASGGDGVPVASGEIEARRGVQTVNLQAENLPLPADVRLSGRDDILRDDQAPVASEENALQVGVVADPTQASAITGGPTVIEQALEALDAGALVRPLMMLPDDDGELGRLALLLIDDPSGLTPEARGALTDWLARGGVALGLLGPACESASLGLSFLPFAEGALRWEPNPSAGLDPSSVAWLGEEARGLERLAAKGRVALDSARLPDARVRGRWDDRRAWLLERDVGDGLVQTLGLPASVALSELALRPGFLALLDHLLTEALHRRGPQLSLVGSLWSFPARSRVEVIGPEGPVACSADAALGSSSAHLSLAGRYQVRVNGREQTRIVRWDEQEILDHPFDVDNKNSSVVSGVTAEEVDVSRETALLVLVLLGLELGTRLVLSRRAPRPALPATRPTES